MINPAYTFASLGLFILMNVAPYRGLCQSNYPEYYRLARNARCLLSMHSYTESAQSYNLAFNGVDYVHNSNLEYAIKACRKAGLDSCMRSYRGLLKNRENVLDKELKAKIDSLYKRDQRVRSRKYARARDIVLYTQADPKDVLKFEQAKKLLQEWRTVDSQNVIILVKTIEEHGFPYEGNASNNTAMRAFTILLHYDRDTNNKITGEIIQEAFNNGRFSPERYAKVIDRRRLRNHKAPYYYQLPVGIQWLTDPELEKIEKRREEIGLSAIFEYRKLIGFGTSIAIKPVKRPCSRTDQNISKDRERLVKLRESLEAAKKENKR